MSILTNAIQAIECGIEDYESGTDARLKSSVRNMHAGILLLLKEKLSRMSDVDSEQALIKQYVVPSLVGDKVVWKGKGKKTVDVHNLKDRLSGLGIKFDWKSFDQISGIRNDVEHYFTEAKAVLIQEAISKSFVLMRDFMEKELRVDPKKQIGSNLWDILIKINEIYEAEKEACLASHKYFKSHSHVLSSSLAELTCLNCDSDLVKFKKKGSTECRSCGNRLSPEKTISALVEIVFAADNYISAKEGCDPKTITCLVCDEDTFIVEEMMCATCGESVSDTCSGCGMSIPVEELGGSMCSYCEHLMSKDD